MNRILAYICGLAYSQLPEWLALAGASLEIQVLGLHEISLRKQVRMGIGQSNACPALGRLCEALL